MSSFLSIVVSLFIGILVTALVSRYYYRKSISKRLTPYIQPTLPLFAGISPEVRSSLKIFHRDKEVQDLFELQFLVVNEGQRAIRDCIEPLTLVLPSSIQVLDASILHVHPEGRTVGVQVESGADGTSRVRFPFAILNRNEGFIAKILLQGTMAGEKLRFEIAVDDLPPVLEARPWELSLEDVEDIEKSSRLELLLWALGFTFLAGIWLYGLGLLHEARPELFPIPWRTFRPNWVNTPVLALWVASILFLLVAVSVQLMILFWGKVPGSRPRLALPPHLRHGPALEFLRRIFGEGEKRGGV